ncbi:MAG: cell division protein ZapA [Eubacteriales bacterium]
MNRVSVKIFGQNYIIVGSKETQEIVEIAAYVDKKMREISEAVPDMQRQTMAVLSAVNLADEYFTTVAELKKLSERFQKMETTLADYEKLWNEAKQSHMNSQNTIAELENKNKLVKDMLEERIAELEKAVAQKDEKIRNMEELSKKLKGDLEEASSDLASELEAKYKDLESSFFDIQMENIQLKGELERYKKSI